MDCHVARLAPSPRSEESTPSVRLPCLVIASPETRQSGVLGTWQSTFATSYAKASEVRRSTAGQVQGTKYMDCHVEDSSQ